VLFAVFEIRFNVHKIRFNIVKLFKIFTVFFLLNIRCRTLPTVAEVTLTAVEAPFVAPKSREILGRFRKTLASPKFYY
jgi:hypothetical protein